MINGRLIVPMFHPAAALHQPSLKPQIIEDFKKLPALLEQTKKGKATLPVVEKSKEEPKLPVKEEEPPAEQLSLF